MLYNYQEETSSDPDPDLSSYIKLLQDQLDLQKRQSFKVDMNRNPRNKAIAATQDLRSKKQFMHPNMMQNLHVESTNKRGTGIMFNGHKAVATVFPKSISEIKKQDDSNDFYHQLGPQQSTIAANPYNNNKSVRINPSQLQQIVSATPAQQNPGHKPTINLGNLPNQNVHKIDFVVRLPLPTSNSNY